MNGNRILDSVRRRDCDGENLWTHYYHAPDVYCYEVQRAGLTPEEAASACLDGAPVAALADVVMFADWHAADGVKALYFDDGTGEEVRSILLDGAVVP